MRLNRRHWILGSAAASAASAWAPARPGEASAQPPGRSFTGEALREIAFPLGGIGTGTISLGGLGDLRDWEIFNRPNKGGGHLPYTFAALRLSGGDLERPMARVLERQVLPPYGRSHGIGREYAAGLPRFREATFIGAYPFATVLFEGAPWPADVRLDAFNPLVPLNTAASSLPVAVLEYTVRSRADAPLEATLAFSMTNPVGWEPGVQLQHRRAACFGGNVNEFRDAAGARGIFMRSDKYRAQSFRFGDVTLATAAPDVSYRLQWEHGALWDELPAWWRDFSALGRQPGGVSQPSDPGHTEYCTLAAHFTLQPGARRRIPFVIAWRFPHIEDYWTGLKPYYFSQQVSPTRLIRNHYGTEWRDSWEPAVHTLRNLAQLRARSERYRDTLYSSTLPGAVIDAVSTQVSTLRTNTVLVEEGPRVLAFEGCADDQGSCPMNCTHVFNYEQSLAHLFPALERTMREIDLEWNLREDGYMSFRTATPVQRGAYTKHAAADGQMGTILKLYREWRLGADDAWLRRLWPAAKRALEYAWQSWDRDRDGVMDGEQHNTYDVRFHGPNTMVGTLYLGALAAGARIARHLGDGASAERYATLLRAGAAKLDRLLWNGHYYVQKTDVSKPWQFGEGCLSDQLLGQWWAELLDLGKLLPHEHIRQALGSVYRHNFRESLEELASAQRIYAVNGEQGLVVCSWPRGGRPAQPFGYSDEVWTGVEYEVAAHLIFEGMVKEGVRMVEAVRARHDGSKRNPWDETEAGHHYARALSSWSLLNAFAGFACSAPEKSLRFRPAASGGLFRCFFSSGTAWGSYEQRGVRERDVRLRIEGGTLELAVLRIPAAGECRVEKSSARAVGARDGSDAVIRFREQLKLGEGSELALRIV